MTENFVTLEIGMVGDPVLAAQRYVGVPETGWYDDITAAGVGNFQFRHNLPRTGQLDAATDALMFPQLPQDAPPPHIPVTGTLDRTTVCALQRKFGIKQDGFIGDDTARALVAAGMENFIQYQYTDTWVDEVAQLQKSLSEVPSLSTESEETNV